MSSPTPSGYRASLPARNGNVFLVLLCFFVVVAAVLAGIFYALTKDIDEDAPKKSNIAISPDPRTIEIDLGQVHAYRNGPAEVADTRQLPPRIVARLATQSRLFEAVVDASERMQNTGMSQAQTEKWEQLKASFPDQLYYSRPMNGRYKVGSKADITRKYGSSNTMPMSFTLYNAFLTLINNAEPSDLATTIQQFKEKTEVEIAARDYSKVKARARDSATLPRAHAEREWLDLIVGYTNQLNAASYVFQQVETVTPEMHREHLDNWVAFNKEHGQQLANWYRAEGSNPRQFNDATLSFTTTAYPVVRIPIGEYFLYITPDTTPKQIEFTQDLKNVHGVAEQ